MQTHEEGLAQILFEKPYVLADAGLCQVQLARRFREALLASRRLDTADPVEVQGLKHGPWSPPSNNSKRVRAADFIVCPLLRCNLAFPREITKYKGELILTYRKLIEGTALAVLAVAASLSTAAAAEPLTYFTWAGYDDPAFRQPFTEKYGENGVSFSFFSSPDEAFAK